jgi:alpha-beta hydrolase superfamily lysophospholipase
MSAIIELQKGVAHEFLQACFGNISREGTVEIFHRGWLVSDPRAVLVIVHGLSEHSGRYSNIISALEGSGISIYSFDLRGFGQSGGKRGHVDSFLDYIYDLKLFVNFVKENNRNLPLFMLGHSLGGVIACRYALDYAEDLRGLILSSAGLRLLVEIPGWKKRLANLLSSWMPAFSLPNGLNPRALTHDMDAVDAYENDPLVHDRVSIRFWMEFNRAASECLNRSYEIRTPMLLIHGKSDPIIDYIGSEIVYERSASRDKELRLFDGLYHETMNELPAGRQKVLSLIVSWLNRRAGSKAVSAKKAVTKKGGAKKALSASKKTTSAKSQKKAKTTSASVKKKRAGSEK